MGALRSSSTYPASVLRPFLKLLAKGNRKADLEEPACRSPSALALLRASNLEPNPIIEEQGLNCVPRCIERVYNQFRLDRVIFSKKFQFHIGSAESDRCESCGGSESAEHLLLCCNGGARKFARDEMWKEVEAERKKKVELESDRALKAGSRPRVLKWKRNAGILQDHPTPAMNFIGKLFFNGGELEG